LRARKHEARFAASDGDRSAVQRGHASCDAHRLVVVDDLAREPDVHAVATDRDADLDGICRARRRGDQRIERADQMLAVGDDHRVFDGSDAYAFIAGVAGNDTNERGDVDAPAVEIDVPDRRGAHADELVEQRELRAQRGVDLRVRRLASVAVESLATHQIQPAHRDVRVGDELSRHQREESLAHRLLGVERLSRLALARQ
jgi:hypothetical protein